MESSLLGLTREIFKCSLLINGKPYRIIELEYYLYNNDHPDPFVHQHEEQKLSNCWYFRRKGGTFKGLDLTLGNNSSYFGVLIRTMETLDAKNPEIISGPCKVVDKILELYGVNLVNDLFPINGAAIRKIPTANNDRKLLLLSEDAKTATVEAGSARGIPVQEQIYCGPRIGLKSKGTKESDDYLNRNYRFCRNYRAIQKQKKTLKLISS
jgi:hypothetical protein